MATTYVSLSKLALYDEKIKAHLAAADETTLNSAKAYADGLAGNYDPKGSAAAVNSALEAYKASNDAAVAAVDTKAQTAQNEVDALETLVGTLPADAGVASVVAYVDKKTSGIATDAALGELQDAVDAIEADYLKAADKTELSTAISDEATTARAAEKANADAIAAIVADYLKSADKTELQGNIDTVSNGLAAVKEDVDAFFADADMTEAAKDTLKELQEYIASDTTGAAAMAESIQNNSNAIDAVEGRLDVVEPKVATAEQDIVDLKAADETISGRLDVVEAQLGDGENSVSDLIATAKQEAIDAAALDATSKANTAEQNAKTYADGLNTAMDTRVATVEGTSHTHANADELALIASGDKAKWDAAAGQAHTHANATVLGGITAEKVTAWDAAEQNAKTYADGLNTSMDTRVASLETWHTNFVEVSEQEILDLFA